MDVMKKIQTIYIAELTNISHQQPSKKKKKDKKRGHFRVLPENTTAKCLP